MYFSRAFSPLALVVLALVLALDVDAAHENLSTPAHHRRSLAFRKKPLKPLEAPRRFGERQLLGNVVGDALGASPSSFYPSEFRPGF